MAYDPDIMDRLFNIAQSRESVARARIVAGIVHKSLREPILAFNSLKTHPFQAKYSKHEHAICLHAETSAIHKSLKILDIDQLTRADLYIVRAKRVSGKWTTGLAKPCIGCARCIATFNIKNVYWTKEAARI